MGESQVGELPARVGPGCESRRGAKRAGDDEGQVGRGTLPAPELFRKGLAVVVGAVEVQKDHKFAVFDLRESALPFLFFGQRGFFLALYALVGLIADFENFYFCKGFQALEVFLLEHVKGLIFHLSNT